MKGIFRLVILSFLVSTFTAKGQTQFSIYGIVSDEKGKPLKAATVFLSGSKHITIADDEGKFMLNAIEPGTHQLVVSMVGYSSISQNLMVTDKSLEIKVILHQKSFALKEVVIGGNENWQYNLAVFKKNFLGFSRNAKKCRILNPEILNFSNNKKTGILKASTDDFLVIENRSLGYKIKYLLKTFEYSSRTATTLYDGETSFEDLPGTKKEKAEWAENREDVYKGSMMHFFRSVYQNNTLKEGFFTHQIYSTQRVTYLGSGEISTSLKIDPRPAKLDTLVYIVDTAVVSLKFKSGLYIRYNPKDAGDLYLSSAASPNKTVLLNKKGSVLNLHLEEALIDRRGSISDYRTFLVRGSWAARRIGDQLPFEYVPSSNLF